MGSWLQSSLLPWAGSWAALALGTAGAAYVAAVSLKPVADTWFYWSPLWGSAWGVIYLLALGGPPAGVTFAVLSLLEIRAEFRFHPVLTGLGAFVGAAFGALGMSFPVNPQFSVIVATFAYAAFVMGHVLDPDQRVSGLGFVALATASTVLLLPPALFLPRLLLLWAAVYAVVVGGAAGKGLWFHRPRFHGKVA